MSRWRILVPAVVVALVLVGHARLLVRADFQYGDDDLEYTIPHAAVFWGSLEHGDSPVWNRFTDLGTPLWSSGPFMGPFHPLFPLFRVFGPGVALNLGYLAHLLLAALGAYLLVRRLGAPREAAAVGGLVLALSGQAVIFPNQGFLPELVAFSMLPWAALGLEVARDRDWRYAALSGLAVGLALLGGNPTYLGATLFTLAAYSLARGLLEIGEARGRATTRALAHLALALAVGLLLAAVHWLPALGELAGSAASSGRRFRAELGALSAPWRILMPSLPLAAPGVKGGWFVGVVPLLLGAAGLRLRRDPALLCGLLAGLAGWLVVISPAIGLYGTLTSLIPGLGIIGYVYPFAMALTFGLALAGARGAALVLEAGRSDASSLAPAVRAAAAMGLLLLVAGGLLLGLGPQGPEREALLEGVRPSLIWIALAGLLLCGLLAAVRRGWLAAARLGPLVLALVALELVLFARNAAEPAGPSLDLQRHFAGGEIAAAIDRDRRLGRVLLQQTRTHERDWALRRNESLVRRFEAANLEAKLVPAAARELSDRLQGISLARDEVRFASVGSDDPRGLRRAGLTVGPGLDEPNARLLDLLNVAYLVLDRDRELAGGRFEPLAEDGTARLWVNREVLPRGRLVYRARVVPDAEVFDALLDPAHDPRREVLLAPRPDAESAAAAIAKAGAGSSASRADAAAEEVRFLALGNANQKLTVKAPTPGLLVLSQSWHPGWRATVNGDPVLLLRADGCFTALRVPAGTSRVGLEFAPRLLHLGAVISALSLLGLIALGIVTWRRQER